MPVVAFPSARLDRSAARIGDPRRLLILTAAIVCVASGPGPVRGQDGSGSDAAAVAGAVMGLYSGAAFGLVGSLFPCNRTLLGPRCAAVSSLAGGAVGLASGAALGRQSSDAILDRARGAAYGALIGGFVGGVLEGSVRQYAWNDAALMAALGAAAGAAPEGAVLGLGAGAVLGGLAWLVLPRGSPGDLAMMALVGSALGGLYDWVAEAADPHADGGMAVAASFSIPIG